VTVGGIVVGVLQIFILLLIFNLIITWVMIFARDWEPKGVVLVLVEGVFAVTDPPLKLLRRFIPPLRIGGAAIDIAFIVLFIVVELLIVAASRF
jgi:YggT family protein